MPKVFLSRLTFSNCFINFYLSISNKFISKSYPHTVKHEAICRVCLSGLVAAGVAHGINGDEKLAHGHNPVVAAPVGELNC